MKDVKDNGNSNITYFGRTYQDSKSKFYTNALNWISKLEETVRSQYPHVHTEKESKLVDFTNLLVTRRKKEGLTESEILWQELEDAIIFSGLAKNGYYVVKSSLIGKPTLYSHNIDDRKAESLVLLLNMYSSSITEGMSKNIVSSSLDVLKNAVDYMSLLVRRSSLTDSRGTRQERTLIRGAERYLGSYIELQEAVASRLSQEEKDYANFVLMITSRALQYHLGNILGIENELLKRSRIRSLEEETTQENIQGKVLDGDKFSAKELEQQVFPAREQLELQFL